MRVLTAAAITSTLIAGLLVGVFRVMDAMDFTMVHLGDM